MPKAQLFERFCFIFQLLKVGLFISQELNFLQELFSLKSALN